MDVWLHGERPARHRPVPDRGDLILVETAEGVDEAELAAKTGVPFSIRAG
ncbi:hypothetical protein NB693_21175 [Pantoea ananatis]|nr:hypothetical protein [Pantoea ananatis]